MTGTTLAKTVSRSRAAGRLAVTALVAAALVGAFGGSAVAFAAASPPVNGALPVISGTARQGQSLSTTSGSWGGQSPITFTYRWLRCAASGANCGSISSATAATYNVTSRDVGHTLRVAVKATNADGVAEVLSAPTGVVAKLGDAPASIKQPDPSGTPKEGSKVSVNNGTWAGSQPLTYSYHWQRCKVKNGACTYISGATGRTRTVVAADVGFSLRAAVTASNSFGKATAFSNLTAVVAAKGQAPTNLTRPLIAGTPAVGQTLVAASGTWTGASFAFGYQWLRCNASGGGCADIQGATAQSYTVTASDAGGALVVRVTASNDIGSATATSGPLAVVTGGGYRSVPVASLVARPDHLLISSVHFSPSPFRTRNGVITARFRVTVEGTKNVVSGALVKVVGIPYNWVVQPPETATGPDGWVTLRIKTTRRMPLTRGGALVFQVRARAPGTSAAVILGGISTRRLVQVSLGPPR
jgi:hypothetical protein